MKNTYITTAIIGLFAIGFMSCEKLDMEKQPGTDNISIFNEYHNILKTKYAMTEDKGINWDKVYAEYSGYINNSISKDSLSNTLGKMMLLTKDGHTWLSTDAGQYGYGFDIQNGYQIDLDRKLVETYYLGNNPKKVSDSMQYTTLQQDIALVVYRDFDNVITEEGINQMLTDLKDTKGMILDVRGNGGGDPEMAGMLAGHFTNNRVYAGFESFKTGPGKSDFSQSEIYLEAGNGVKYLKPIAMLTDRGVFSATLTLQYLTDPLKNTFTVGARSGGGSGSTSDGQLANGWLYSLSVSEFIDAKGRHIDNGILPDVEVHLDATISDRDEIIEKAIQEILKM
jgi:hypothetical protein